MNCFSFVIVTLALMLGSTAYSQTEACGSKSYSASQTQQMSAFFKKYKNNISSQENFVNAQTTSDATVLEMKVALCKIIGPLINGGCKPSDISLGAEGERGGGALTIVLKNPNRGTAIIAPDIDSVMNFNPPAATTGQLIVNAFVNPNDGKSRILLAGTTSIPEGMGCVTEDNQTKTFATNYRTLRCPCDAYLNFMSDNKGVYSLKIPKLLESPNSLTVKSKNLIYYPPGVTVTPEMATPGPRVRGGI